MNGLEKRAQEEQRAIFDRATKLVALMQCTVEQMDTLKGSKMYKQKIKNLVNQLESEIERVVYLPLKHLDGENEHLVTHLQDNINVILDMSLEELALMQVSLDDHRKEKEVETE
jgi:hypothetical protein